jgi:hypothetical protein
MAEIKEGTIGRHKKTGEQLIRRNGEWVPLESAPIQAGSPAAAAMTHTTAAQPSAEARGPTPFTVDRDTGAMRPLSGMEKFRYGFGLGARNIGLNLAEMLGVTSPERVREAQKEAAPITGQFPGNVGAFAGETGMLLPVGMGVGGMATRMGMAPRGVLAGVTEGGVQGAVAAGPDDPSTESSERLMGLGVGAATGGALPSAKRMAQMLATGRDMTPAARRLTERGVDLTPGQMQPESTYGQIEEAMMAIPGIGPRIKAARERGWTQTQNLIAQEAAPPGFTMQPRQDPQAMFRDLIDAYDKAYEVGKGFPVSPRIMRMQGKDVPLSDALKVPARAFGDDASRKYANSFLANEWSALRGRQLQSDDLFALRSRIRAKARDLRQNKNAPFEAADMLESAEKRVTEALESQLPPDVMRQIRAIDGKYGNFKVVEGALFRAGDREGGFTPAQFSQEVRQGAQSRMGYAAGGGRMRNIASAGREVFENRQPQTGRLMLTAAPVVGAGGAAATFGGLPGALAAGAFTGAAALPYLRNAAGDVARDVLVGRTAPQVALRNVQRKIRRNFTPQERETVARLLATQGIVLGATPEEQE